MEDHDKTKAQLIAELNDLRQKVAVLEAKIPQQGDDLPFREEHEHRYQNLFDNSLNGLILNELVFNEAGEPVDVIIREVNRAFEQQTGLRAADVVNKKLSESLPAAFQRGLWREHVSVALTGQPLRIERYSVETGRYYDTFVFCPQPNYFAVTFVDITAQKQTAKALQESEAQFKLAFRAAKMGVWHWNIASGEVYWSEEMERLASLEPGTFGGTYSAYLQLVYPADVPIVKKTIKQLLDPKRTADRYSIEHRFTQPDGTPGWIEAEGQLFRDEAGQPTKLLGIAMNITARKEAEEILRQSEARYRALAEENAQLLDRAKQDTQTKTMLLNEVNHRVKNNLTAIGGLLVIEKRYAPAEGRSFIVAALDRLNHRIQGLIETHNLLSQTEWSPVPLTDLTDRVVRRILQALASADQLDLVVSPSPIKVSPRQASNLALIINELVTNTVKHAVSSSLRATEIRVAIASGPESNQLEFEFRDNGPGFPVEILDLRPNELSSDKALTHAGLYLMYRITARTLRGKITLLNDHGAVVKLQFKAEEESYRSIS